MRQVKAILVNTFLELKTYTIQSLSADITITPVYAVGAILNLEGGGSCGAKKSDDEVISWLDSQPPSSVVFLCFGSMGSFKETQVKEIAHALEKSGHRFVWSLRRQPSREHTTRFTGDYEDTGAVLPEGFLERTAGIGKVIGWAPQITLLAHCTVQLEGLCPTAGGTSCWKACGLVYHQQHGRYMLNNRSLYLTW